MNQAQTAPTVLCAVDFEHNSLSAERLALFFGRTMKFQTDFLHTSYEAGGTTAPAAAGGFALPAHVLDAIEKQIREEKMGLLHWRMKAIGAQPSDSDIHCFVNFGDVVQDIKNHVKSRFTKLLVIGKRRRSFFSEFLLGSVGNRLLHECPLQTLIVPDDEKIFLNWKPQKIVVALSFDSGSREVWKQAQAYAALFSASIKIVHVALSWEGLTTIGKDNHRSEFGAEVLKLVNSYETDLTAKVENFCQELEIDRKKVVIDIRRGSVTSEIFSFLETEQPDLVVVGASDAAKSHLKTLGSVAAAVARTARYPVLVVQE